MYMCIGVLFLIPNIVQIKEKHLLKVKTSDERTSTYICTKVL